MVVVRSWINLNVDLELLWCIEIELTDNYDLLIFKFKQYKDVNIASFVYYGKTLLIIVALLFRCSTSDEPSLQNICVTLF